MGVDNFGPMTNLPDYPNYTNVNPQTRVFDLSDKLKIINQALTNTGNNPVDVYDDTSDEWRVANNAYEQAVLFLLGEYDWNFSTDQIALQRLGDSNYPGYKDVFAKPVDCIQIVNVWRMDDQQRLEQYLSAYHRAMADMYPPALTYRVIGDAIHTIAPEGVYALYTKFPQGAQDWSTGFQACLRTKIEANIYRALNEDYQMATAWEKYVDELLVRAKARNAQEDSTRVMFKSRLAASRFIRRYGGGYRY